MVQPLIPGAEPFVYSSPDSALSCLLLHGLTATPQEMRRLGQFLRNCGFTVSCPLLAGHGTDVHALQATNWQDWYGSAYAAWTALHDDSKQVFAIGLSLGGALALNLAAQEHLDGVVTMAAPMLLDSRLLWTARLLKYIVHYRKKGASHLLDAQALASRIADDHNPTRRLEQALLLFRQVYRVLPQVQVPVLLFHSRHDKSIDPASMPRIFERVGSQDRRMIWLEKSGHIIPEDLERDAVYDEMRQWILQHVRPV